MQMIEGLQGKFDVVFQRLDGIDSRLSSIEIATKEVLNNQRNLQVQQRKLQDIVERDTPTPRGYDEVRKTSTATPAPVYIPPPGALSTLPSYHSTGHVAQMPSLVPVTQIREADILKADMELAKKLQAAFDQEQKEQEPPKSYSSPQKSIPTSTTSSSQQQECPICQVKVLIADLEAHVEQHFEDDEGKKGKDSTKDKDPSTPSAAKSFLSKFFGSKEEDKDKDKDKEKKTENTATTTTNSSSNTSSTPKSYDTHTSSNTPSSTNLATPANMMHYPYMPPNARGYPPYGAPVPTQGQYRGQQFYPSYPTPAQMQRMGGQPNPYMYYPSLDPNHPNQQ